MKSEFEDLNASLQEMRRQAQEMRDEVQRMSSRYSWSEWEPHTVGIIPKRINGRWYFKGDTVYRQEKMLYLTSSKQYRYGDEFDILQD